MTGLPDSASVFYTFDVMDDRDHQPVERLKTDDGTIGHPTSHGGRGVSRRRALVIAASLIGVGGAGIAVARTIAPER